MEVIDADGHVLEPGDVWDDYLPRDYRSYAPGWARDSQGRSRRMIEGRLQRRDRTINLLAVRLHRLDDARETFGEWERQVLPQVQEIDVLAADQDATEAPIAEPIAVGVGPEREAWEDSVLERLTPASHNYR